MKKSWTKPKEISLEGTVKRMRDTRKMLAQKVRETITGGDVLLLEDFEVDMARVIKSTIKHTYEQNTELSNRQLARSWLKRKSKRAVVNDQKSTRQIIVGIVKAYQDDNDIPEEMGRKI
jgi:hypothetical protein